MRGIEEGANRGDRRRWLLLHQPMTGIGNDRFGHIVGGEAHDERLHRTERPLAAYREHRHRESGAAREEGAIVDGVLIERGELREARMHRAGLRIELRVVAARPFAELPWVRRELVPEPIEVDPLASRDEALHVGTAEAKVPQERILEHLLPWPDAGDGRVHDHEGPDALGVL